MNRKVTKGGEVELGCSRGKPRGLPGGGRDGKRGATQGDLGANPGGAPSWLWAKAMIFVLRLGFLICKMGS